MMSAYDVKVGHEDRRHVPREGTITRAVYDLFLAFKFEPLRLKDIEYVCGGDRDTIWPTIQRLHDECDMEIVRVERGIYVFAGFIDKDGRLE